MGTFSAGDSGVEEHKAGTEDEVKLLAVLSSHWLSV